MLARSSRLGMKAALALMLAFGVAVAMCVEAAPASGLAGRAYAASVQAKNAKAHAAYGKKLAKLAKENGSIVGLEYMCVDITGDGVDDMLVQWWPAIYTYKGGKVKRVYNGFRGGLAFTKVYKSKKVVVTNASGGLTYLKWNGKKFKKMVTIVDNNIFDGGSTYYWVTGKGEVTEKKAKAFAKKLVGNAKSQKVKYRAY